MCYSNSRRTANTVILVSFRWTIPKQCSDAILFRKSDYQYTTTQHNEIMYIFVVYFIPKTSNDTMTA
jgi:hypothetical protein